MGPCKGCLSCREEVLQSLCTTAPCPGYQIHPANLSRGLGVSCLWSVPGPGALCGDKRVVRSTAQRHQQLERTLSIDSAGGGENILSFHILSPCC